MLGCRHPRLVWRAGRAVRLRCRLPSCSPGCRRLWGADLARRVLGAGEPAGAAVHAVVTHPDGVSGRAALAEFRRAVRRALNRLRRAVPGWGYLTVLEFSAASGPHVHLVALSDGGAAELAAAVRAAFAAAGLTARGADAVRCWGALIRYVCGDLADGRRWADPTPEGLKGTRLWGTGGTFPAAKPRATGHRGNRSAPAAAIGADLTVSEGPTVSEGCEPPAAGRAAGWRPIPGFAPNVADATGRIGRELPDGTVRVRRTYPDRAGYLRVNLRVGGRDKKALVNRLVALAFLGPCPAGQECRHLNSIRADNRAANLAWGTKAEQMADRDAAGNTARGTKNGRSKTDPRLVCALRVAAELGHKVSVRRVAKAVGLDGTTLSKAVRGGTWGTVWPPGREGTAPPGLPASLVAWLNGVREAVRALLGPAGGGPGGATGPPGPAGG